MGRAAQAVISMVGEAEVEAAQGRVVLLRISTQAQGRSPIRSGAVESRPTTTTTAMRAGILRSARRQLRVDRPERPEGLCWEALRRAAPVARAVRGVQVVPVTTAALVAPEVRGLVVSALTRSAAQAAEAAAVRAGAQGRVMPARWRLTLRIMLRRAAQAGTEGQATQVRAARVAQAAWIASLPLALAGLEQSSRVRPARAGVGVELRADMVQLQMAVRAE